MTKHSAIVGGSTCGRLLNCPGSHQAILALPPTVEVPSPYAEEGTFAHAAMAHLLGAVSVARNRSKLVEIARCLVGTTIYDRALTAEHLDTLIEPALVRLAELEALYGGDFRVTSVEQRVKFNGVPGAFGTVDLTLVSDTHIVHVDWKFGQGIGVQATYEDGALVNPQLLFYATAHLHTFPGLATRRKIVVAIIQPRSEQPLTHVELERKELRTFAEDIQNAVSAAIGRDPPIRKGEHCRFAPCKVSCPLWTGPVAELAGLQPAERQAVVLPDQNTAYGEYLAKAKALVDTLDLYKKSIDEQLHAHLEHGGRVPGWRLKPKTKLRQWVDPETVTTELARLGFQHDEIWTKKLQTFAATDAIARRRGVKIPDNLRVMPPTNETTIAPIDDPAPVAKPTHVLVEQFQKSLLALRLKPLWIETTQTGV
jgi:hypothetical protein